VLTLRFEGPSLPAQVLREQPGTPWIKRGPRMMQDLSGAGLPEPNLGAGPQMSQPRRLDCLRDVHLVWSNLFITGANDPDTGDPSIGDPSTGDPGAEGAGVRCATIFDRGVPGLM